MEKTYIFSKGNWLLKSKVEELLRLHKYDRIVVYVDLVLNNPETINVYEDLIDLHESEEWKYVKIIPILCIEYFICKALVKRDILDTRGVESIVNNMILNYSYSQVDNKMRGSSHEKTLKRILSSNRSKCYRNTIDKSNSIYGKFYLEDCTCDSKYCFKKCTGLTQEIKAAYVYCELPVMVLNDETVNILNKLELQVKQVDYEAIQSQVQEQYDCIARDMKLSSDKYIEIII